MSALQYEELSFQKISLVEISQRIVFMVLPWLKAGFKINMRQSWGF